jgi:putative peptidoglycan lipid II flippase
VVSVLRRGIEKGKHLVGGRQEGILSAAFIMMILVALTKIVGFAKIHMFARIFGASRELDIFWAAFTIPDIIFNVIVLGSVNAALIPSFAEALGEGRIRKLFSDIIRLFLLAIVVFCVVGFIFAPQAARLVSTGALGGLGFEGGDFSPADVELMALLMRLMMLSPIILGVSSIITAGLQVNKRFFLPALAPLLYNVGIIVGAIVFTSQMHLGVVGLAYGVILGSILHLIVQIPILKKLGLSVDFSGSFLNRDVLRVVKLALPRVFGLVGEQISILVNTVISMGLGSGALSAFRYASSLYLMPVQLLGTTIAQAALPTLSLEYNASSRLTLLDDGKKQHDLDQFGLLFSKTLQQILFYVLPAVVFFVVLRLPIVRLVLGAGAFDWEDTVMTAWVLALFGIAMLMHSVVALVVRAFYAMHDTIVPVVVSFFSLVVNIVGSILFTNFFSHYYDWRPLLSSVINRTGAFSSEFWTDLARWFTTRNSSPSAVGGLALSAGVALLVEGVLLLLILNRRVRILSWRRFWKPTLRKLFATWVMATLMYSLYTFWNFKLDTSTVLSIILLFIVVGGVGMGVYIVVSEIMDIRETEVFSKLLKKGIAKARLVWVTGMNGGV